MCAKTFLFEDSDFIDFELYGVSSQISDSVQFAFNLNSHFHTKFHRIEDLDVLIENQAIFCPVYEWEDESTQIVYHIVKNSAYSLKSKQKNGNLSSLFDVAPILIPQHKEYNYFLKVNPEIYQELPIRENHFIQKITKLDTDKIKNIANLIF